MTSATIQFFSVYPKEVSKCKYCGGLVYWQQSRRGSKYPTDVLVQNGQQYTARSNFHKCDQATRDAYQKRQLEAAGQQTFAKKLNMAGVNSLFDKAVASGLKYPKIRLQTQTGQKVCLARAGNRSRHPGHIMVTDGEPFGYNKFFGRVDQTGQYHPADANTDEVHILLEQLGSDPATVASKFGKLTGNCCFCMHSLDDERSTEVGYGPVCAKHFGLPWG